jgi:hypothetical protein
MTWQSGTIDCGSFDCGGDLQYVLRFSNPMLERSRSDSDRRECQDGRFVGPNSSIVLKKGNKDAKRFEALRFAIGGWDDDGGV